MLASLKARRDREEGFTLIELMVVVLIIAILIAIAIPTFLGARQRAEDRAAQSSARNGLTAAKTLFTDNESYLNADVAGANQLPSVEPSLTYKDSTTASTGQNDLSIAVANVVAANADHAQITIAVKSKSGTCFLLRDVALTGGSGAGSTPGTWYTTGTGTCAAGSATAGTWVNTGW